MLRTFSAIEFIQPAERGGNLPMLIRGRGEGEEEVSIYLKTKAGYGDRPAAPGIELFTTLTAVSLGLRAPEPVLVEVGDRFHEQIFGAPDHRRLVQQSPGLNFGTISLGSDWKTWPVEMSQRAFAREVVESILFFDAIVQHTDRGADNPNLMWRGHEIAVIDHEKCFGYLALTTGANVERPWREFFSRRPMRQHCLVRDAIRGDDFGKEMWENLVGIEIAGRIPEFVRTTTAAFPEANLELGRVSAYFDSLFRDIGDFIACLKHSLNP